ncbi:hypothetical protein ACS0TY_002845 [Phlomoides rotata]
MGLMLIYYMILLIPPPPFVSPLSFNLSTIGPNVSSQIKTQGSAFISEEGIEASTELYRSARATYVDPLHLWDESSGQLADFNTHFSFIIQKIDNNITDYGNGLAFFMGPVNARIPDNAYGNALGLGVRDDPTAKPEDPFVAVEFDTFTNDWDPQGPHVGIDISSIKSAANVSWPNNMTAGKVNDAWITYDSTSQIIRVVFTSYMNNKTQTSTLEHRVDLRLELPEWVSIGFSAATGKYTQIHNVKSWDFNSTQVSVPDSTGMKMKAGEVIGLVVGLSVSIFGLILLGYCLWQKRSKNGNEEESVLNVSMENEFERASGPKKFSYAELVLATDNFSEKRKLGEGGFGGVYKGFLKDSKSCVAAVKRVSKSSSQGEKEYASEVKIISRLRHRNLVQLIGWCHEQKELLLVYEFLPNGSLDSHLFKGKSLLTWETRYKVVQGLASALLYLHEEGEQCVIHRDIKSSNIMLDSSFNAKLGDFGLARLVDHEAEAKTTAMAGTLGYMAPELVITGKASKESDVYSFGIVALEITCGRRPVDLRAPENEARMVEWVWELYGRGVHLEAADPKLGREFDEEKMERLMVVGLWCAHPDYTLRPSIRQVIHVLSFEPHEPPILPSTFPVPTYSVSPPHARTSLQFESSSGAGTSDSYPAEKPVSTASEATTSSSSSKYVSIPFTI